MLFDELTDDEDGEDVEDGVDDRDDNGELGEEDAYDEVDRLADNTIGCCITTESSTEGDVISEGNDN